MDSKAYHNGSLNGTQCLYTTATAALCDIATLSYLSRFRLFQGVVAFSSQGDRIALTQIEQMINGTYSLLGYYDTQADNLTWQNAERWVGGKVRAVEIRYSQSKT